MSAVPSGLDAWLDHNERISSGSAPSNPKAGGQRITRAATHAPDTWHHAGDVAQQAVERYRK